MASISATLPKNIEIPPSPKRSHHADPSGRSFAKRQRKITDRSLEQERRDDGDNEDEDEDEDAEDEDEDEDEETEDEDEGIIGTDGVADADLDAAVSLVQHQHQIHKEGQSTASTPNDIEDLFNVEELHEQTVYRYKLKLVKFDEFLREKEYWTNEKTVFDVDLNEVPQETPRYIQHWIGEACDPAFIEKSNQPRKQARSFSTASQMLGAIKWGFSRDTRRSSTWIWDAKSEAFTGNPAHCVKLARYMNSLHRKKTANGECATSSRAINGYHMQQLSDHLNGWLRNNADLDRSSQRSQDDWGGPLKRFSTYLIGLIAFRCLLRTCDVVKLTMDHLSFEPLNGDRTHVSIQPWTSKTQQTGSVEPFDFFLETDEKLLDFCIVRALHRWLKMSGIRQGNLFPKIYGYDSMQDSERGPPTSKTDFLKNLRCSLQDIGETPSKFTIHAFRRGGTQFLYEVLKFNLIKILQWGKWSTKLTYATILRYLIADTDLMKTPRSLIMYPNRA